MIISLNWLRDFVDIPASLNPQQLALKFTTTTAEVEGVVEHRSNFEGLLAGRIDGIEPVDGEAKLKRVQLTADRAYSTLSAAPDLSVGDVVIFGPPGARIAGQRLTTKDPAGRESAGMIVAGQAIHLTQVGAGAVFLPPSTRPGSMIDSGPFNDWLIEIDNKSITHRPDLWGHYGIAREFAAMLGTKVRKYDVTDAKGLRNELPEVPITVDDPTLCRRYSALVFKGLRPQPSPLTMQIRLAFVGMRPIDLIVDLTNYVMAELGQPMHAFDAAKLTRIEVAVAAPKEKFTTLDGVTRTLPAKTLMIQSGRKSVAIAGIMGGAETEVSKTTETILLESANFEAAAIRRAAVAMGHRTEASARFEKSLDPEQTVTAIARFHKLAKAEVPGLSLAGTLSDCYPSPRKIEPITLDCDVASQVIGKDLGRKEISRILTAIDFKCERAKGSHLSVTPPTYRATKDISIQEDLIEEVARFVGYDSIESELPRITARHFDEPARSGLEEATLDYLCVGGDFAEVHDYIWFDDDWCRTLGFEVPATLTLKNPAAAGCSRLRTTLIPGMLAMTDANRRVYDRFQLAQIGGVFFTGSKDVEKSQRRHLGLIAARSGAKADQVVWDHLRHAISGWGRQVLETSVDFAACKAEASWEDADRIAAITAGGRELGRMSIVPLALKQAIDERLKSWSIALAEINLTAAQALPIATLRLPRVERFPQVQLDFSLLIDATRRYAEVRADLQEFKHPLLKGMTFVESYDGKNLGGGKRSLTIRATIGAADRTLSDEDSRTFSEAFRSFIAAKQMELRA